MITLENRLTREIEVDQCNQRGAQSHRQAGSLSYIGFWSAE
jgi:hypothetical protein